ncbi:MAG: MGMT family protein, partial [Bacteroidaceae bacterium]
GTAFQLKVWKALLKIPVGDLVTYRFITELIQYKKAYQAVGSAIGRNPIYLLIPCHRVIRTDGEIGGYRWGNKIKTKIITAEKKLKEHFNK